MCRSQWDHIIPPLSTEHFQTVSGANCFHGTNIPWHHARERVRYRLRIVCTGNDKFRSESRPAEDFLCGCEFSLWFSSSVAWAHFDQTSGVLDIVEAFDIFETLKAEESGQGVDPHRSVLSSLAIAIGALCHPDAMAYRICERVHFQRARPYLTLDKMEDLNLDTIRLFTLAGFYMLCSCRRNMGYMYLGLAARAAHVMGLHHSGLLPNLPEAEKCSR